MDTPSSDIYLINGNITIFCGSHAEDFKKDILTSSLLAELTTASKQPRNPNLLWSGYVDIVSKIGWITKSREFKRDEFCTTSLLKIVASNAGNPLEKEEKQILLNAFSYLKKSPTQSPVITTILDKLRTNTFISNEEVNSICRTKMPVNTSARLTIVRNNASIITLQVAFKTNDEIGIDILDQPILNSIKDGKSNMWLLVSSLDAREYDKIRETVIKKIGNHINTHLLHVPTPNLVM